MSYIVKQETFEGPLDLLLQLIEAEELDITSIALAEVTDQYLVRVKELERQHLPEITDFLVIAARLLLLKSRALLAEESTEDEELDDLAAQLAEYKLFKELAGKLGEQYELPAQSFGKHPSQVDLPSQFVTDGVSLEHLHQAFTQILERLPEPRPTETKTLDEQLTIDECIAAVKRTTQQGPTAFEQLFAKLRSRLAMIVTFLAILELVKQRLLAVVNKQNRLMVEARA